MLGRLKSLIGESVPLPGEVFLVVAGLGCYYATCRILRRPLFWYGALIPGLLLSLVVEAVEIHAHWGWSGFAGPERSAIFGRHLRDVAIMNLPPAAVASIASWRERTRSSSDSEEE